MIINEKRALAYTAKIEWIKPIEGADNIELVGVLGWTCIAKIGEFSVGDTCVYFEIDSKLPETDWSAFLANKHYKVKTMKLGKFKIISQGLALPFSAFEGITLPVETGVDLTDTLKVTYSVEEDNKRKNDVNPNAKYNSMSARHKNLARKTWWRWLMKRDWGKKLLFFFFGKKRDNPKSWPLHIAAKTDVERIQNMMYILNDKQPFVATEKVDGSSCSIMAERTKWGKIKQYVCSRNVVFETPNDACFYEHNIYFEAYEKYDLKEKIVQIMNDLNLKNIAIQMEVFGPSVQKRDYSLNEREARVFHIVSEGVKFPMDKTVEICEKYDIPHVPVIDDNYILPDTIEELQEFVEGAPSMIDGKEKEGIVFYDKKTGQQYFKFVSPNYLLKFHQ